MKSYVIDELRYQDYEKLKAYLDEAYEQDTLGGLYWMPLPEDQLGPEQVGHDDCRPFYLALELMEDRLACELLVRTRQRVRCTCMRYATATQREWMISVVDAILEKLALIA
ncbi:MAG: hypothetical protein QNJ22_23725 [Desulfosarcinaceae bacterium]|nr:hypothetical protein [Desulfosarcinaceae bacterium]